MSDTVIIMFAWLRPSWSLWASQKSQRAYLFARLPRCILLCPAARGRARMRPTSLAVCRLRFLVRVVFRWAFHFLVKPCCNTSHWDCMRKADLAPPLVFSVKGLLRVETSVPDEGAREHAAAAHLSCPRPGLLCRRQSQTSMRCRCRCPLHRRPRPRPCPAHPRPPLRTPSRAHPRRLRR